MAGAGGRRGAAGCGGVVSVLQHREPAWVKRSCKEKRDDDERTQAHWVSWAAKPWRRGGPVLPARPPSSVTGKHADDAGNVRSSAVTTHEGRAAFERAVKKASRGIGDATPPAAQTSD